MHTYARRVLTTPFWTEDFPRPADLTTSPQPGRVDVAVVGGGVTGLAAALRLARSGATVAVIDAGEIGAGASTISGGMTIYGMKAGTHQTIRRYGRDLAIELWQASLDSIDLVEKLVVDEDISCDFVRNGAAELGYTNRDGAGFQAESTWMRRELGFETEFVPRERLSDVIGSKRFSAALVDSFSGGVHPAKYTFGLAEVAAAAGVMLVENLAVLGIDRAGPRHAVRTPRGVVEADQVLLATNGYRDDVVPEFRRRVVPVGSYIVVTEPLPLDVRAEVNPRNLMMWTARRFINYFRLTPDGRFLMGGRQDLTTDLDLARSAEVLRRTIEDFHPQLAGAEITHSWSGKVGVTFDLHPHITDYDGVWVAGGYSGHGMATATYVGYEVAGLMTGELERSPYADIPFPSRWFYRKKAWFLPAAAMLYRGLDRFGR